MPKGQNRETVAGGTVRLHRVFATKPEKVFRAFLDAEAMAKWLPPNGFTCKVHHMDAKVGGTFRMSFTNFTTKASHSFSGEYLEIVPNERLRYTDRFDDPNLPGVIEVTVTLKAGFRRNRDQHRTDKPSGGDSGRSLLSGLATVAHPACVAGGAGNSRNSRGIESKAPRCGALLLSARLRRR